MIATSGYFVFGLYVRSVLPLPGLMPFSGERETDVEISFGAVPCVAGAPDGYHILADGTLLTIPDVARFWIEGGRRIVIDAAPDVAERNIRLFTLGSALGAILHQRGILPLHANAIDLGGRAVAFMGPSGAGKSTLAAWFLDHGHDVFSDDVCAITLSSDGKPCVARGLSRLRLRHDALSRSGREAREEDRSFEGQDKFDVFMPARHEAAAALPLTAAVLLDSAADDEQPTVMRLRGADAVDALMANVYRGGFATMSGHSGNILGQCLAIANAAPVLRFRRRWGLDFYEEQATFAAHEINRLVHDDGMSATVSPQTLDSAFHGG